MCSGECILRGNTEKVQTTSRQKTEMCHDIVHVTGLGTHLAQEQVHDGAPKCNRTSVSHDLSHRETLHDAGHGQGYKAVRQQRRWNQPIIVWLFSSEERGTTLGLVLV